MADIRLGTDPLTRLREKREHEDTNALFAPSGDAPLPDPPCPTPGEAGFGFDALEVLERTAHPLCVSALDGTVRYANPALLALTGYAAEQALGLNREALFMAAPPLTEPGVDEELLASGGSKAYQATLKCADGSQHTVELRRTLGERGTDAGEERYFFTFVTLPGQGLAAPEAPARTPGLDEETAKHRLMLAMAELNAASGLDADTKAGAIVLKARKKFASAIRPCTALLAKPEADENDLRALLDAGLAKLGKKFKLDAGHMDCSIRTTALRTTPDTALFLAAQIFTVLYATLKKRAKKLEGSLLVLDVTRTEGGELSVVLREEDDMLFRKLSMDDEKSPLGILAADFARRGGSLLLVSLGSTGLHMLLPSGVPEGYPPSGSSGPSGSVQARPR